MIEAESLYKSIMEINVMKIFKLVISTVLLQTNDSRLFNKKNKNKL